MRQTAPADYATTRDLSTPTSSLGVVGRVASLGAVSPPCRLVDGRCQRLTVARFLYRGGFWTRL